MRNVTLFLIAVGVMNVGFIPPVHAQGARYLVITHDDFYEAVLPLAEWRHKKGMKTRVAKLSETGSSVAAIRSYIQNAYNTWNPRPEYVLLVGDTEFLPSHWEIESPTDNHYAKLQGSDYLADVSIGRFCVDNALECSTLVAKTLGYERTPWVGDTEWFHRATLIVREDGDQDDNLWYYPDAQFAYDTLTRNGFTDIDTLYERSGADASNVLESVNKGCIFLGFRGSSSINWSSPFDVDPRHLQNGWRLPIVLSATCLTGCFQEEGADCELWMAAGTPREPKGAVAYLGTNTGRYHSAHIRSSLHRNFFRAIFEENLHLMGDIFVEEKLRFWNEIHDTVDYEGWHLFGDPGLQIWTGEPKIMIVQYPFGVPLGSSNFAVNVKGEDTTALPGATVCVFKEGDIYDYGKTDTNGEVTFSINPSTSDTIWVTITAHNHIPHEGYSVAIPGGPYISKYGHSVIDTADNSDGIPNSGEHIWLPVCVKNYGSIAAYSVSGVLSTEDQYIDLVDSVQFFGDIAPSDTASGLSAYEFLISPDCPGGHAVDFGFDLSDTSGNDWVSSFSITVTAPTIVMKEYTVDDAGQANPNGFIDPGETGRLIITLGNEGDASLESVNAVLRSSDTYVTITDSSSSYGSVAAGAVVDNSSDPFEIQCSASAPLYHRISFSLCVNSPNGYETTLNFTLKVGIGGDYLVWDPDYNHTSGPVVDSLLLENGYSGDYATDLSGFLPFLSEYEVILLFLGVHPYSYTLYTAENAELADSLHRFLGSGGKMYLEGGESWREGSRYSGANIHTYFHVSRDNDGYGDTDTITGMPNTFARSMQFKYSGENHDMDRLRPVLGAWPVFENSPSSYINGAAFTFGSVNSRCKTALFSFELGCLQDDVASRSVLVDSMMKWFLREAHHDVSAWDILSPKYSFVMPESTFVPSARIWNIGEHTENSFEVICQIDSSSNIIYADTSVISSLNSSSMRTVSFRSWTPSQEEGNYTVSFRIELEGDEEYQNDVRTKEVSCFRFHPCIKSGYTLVSPVMDGYIDTTYEWAQSTRIDISNVYGRGDAGKPHSPGSAYLHVMNDDSCMYFGVDLRNDPEMTAWDLFYFCFDDNHDASYPTSMTDTSEGYIGFYCFPPFGMFFYQSLWGQGDPGLYYTDLNVRHGEGNVSGNFQYEFVLPHSSQIAEYLNAGIGDTVGLSLAVGCYDEESGATDFSGWWQQGDPLLGRPLTMGDLVIAPPSGAENQAGMPRVFAISQNMPNPFMRNSHILYQLPVKSRVSLKIYNMAGQLVKTLINGVENVGYKSVSWDRRGNRGKHVTSGIYFYRFETNAVKGNRHFERTKKMILMGK